MQKEVPLTGLLSGYLRYRDEIDSAVSRVLESGCYILGREVKDFETAFAEYCGASEAVGVANGTDAIQLALRTLGVVKGDAVFTVSHTAVATVAAIELAGATPVLVDVDPSNYTIDVQKLEDSICECARIAAPGVPKAVVAVHLYGHPCDVASLRDLCRRYGLFLVEDCAQAHGAAVRGKRVGSLGDAAAFSFYPTKNLAAFGDGGAVVFQASELARRCRALREYGWHTRNASDLQGMNSRLDELQAAILGVRLRHLDDELMRRRSIAAVYNEQLDGVVRIPQVSPGHSHAYHLYVIGCARRDALRAALTQRGIGTGIHYPFPIHHQKAYVDRIKIGCGALPVTERLAQEVLSLPMHPFLSDDDVIGVITAVQSSIRELGRSQ